jgi:hypothetical protein
MNLYFQKAGTTNSLATELQEDLFFYFIKLYFGLYIKPNAIEKSSSINEDIQCGSYEGNY